MVVLKISIHPCLSVVNPDFKTLSECFAIEGRTLRGRLSKDEA